MRIYSIAAAMALCILTSIPYAHAADTVIMESASTKAANASNSQEGQDRAAQLRAEIEASHHHPKATEQPVPLYRKSVRGSEQIKEKIALSKGAGERGDKKLASYIHAILGKGDLSKKNSFEERLKLVREQEQARQKHL